MRSVATLRSFCCVVVSLAVANSSAEAGKIVGFTPFPGINSVAGIAVPPPVDPNNDNVTGPSPNVVEILQKDFVGAGPVDIVFEVMDSGGTTEYLFTEGVSNSTGVFWPSYHLELGFGVGATYTPSPNGDGLDFDAPDYDPYPDFDPVLIAPFPTVFVTENNIDAFGGPGLDDLEYSEPFTFSIDVPDGIDSFTLRQYPRLVPEPTTGILLLLGTLGGLASTLRKSIDS